MATPKGPPLARSGSTWIHWWSSVASAKRLTRSWVMGCHSEKPRSLPTSSAKASTPSMMVVMGLLAGQGLIPQEDATRLGGPHYADAGELHARARGDAAASPPGLPWRRGPGGRLRGERRPGDERLAGARHRGGQPGWLDRTPGGGGRPDCGLLLHGGGRISLHDRSARADG